jgi:hypothetical protein
MPYTLTLSSRRDALNAWLAVHRIPRSDLARALRVHPSMITRILNSEQAPAQRIEQLAELGIPREFLPRPSNPPGRPRKSPHL